MLELSEHSELEAVAMSAGEEEDEATDTALSIAEEETSMIEHDFSQTSASNAPRFITKIKDTRVKKGHKALFECIVPESKGIVVKW